MCRRIKRCRSPAFVSIPIATQPWWDTFHLNSSNKRSGIMNQPSVVFLFFPFFSLFLSLFLFFFRKFSPLYVTILCLVEGRARSRCYILCSFCMSICTLAQIKPQINRSGIHYFVPRLFTSIMYDPPSDNSLVMRAASSTSTLKSAPPILYLFFELLLYDDGRFGDWFRWFFEIDQMFLYKWVHVSDNQWVCKWKWFEVTWWVRRSVSI